MTEKEISGHRLGSWEKLYLRSSISGVWFLTFLFTQPLVIYTRHQVVPSSQPRASVPVLHCQFGFGSVLSRKLVEQLPFSG